MVIEKNETLLVADAVNTVDLGQSARFIVETNPSTGYYWSVIPDNSGTYELVEILNLETRIGLLGTPGKAIYEFKTLREGTGAILFQHCPPGSQEPEEIREVRINIVSNPQ
ncbi:protease inhibitor I42 family protein [Vibrio penaeicida]|uniref:protease inhibitor I42 family protein n=1 Tax=Vibrio penaeicida TaxID=104609 RepID=UPI002736C945|nr:protease inhibitor I42 family protein [Vibrio penaeicida]MDP2574938.1 protease inhibitor I42 family protein [Vibrio penaeicida]